MIPQCPKSQFYVNSQALRCFLGLFLLLLELQSATSCFLYWPDGMYTPEVHKALADGYIADERFRAYYEEVAPGATQFLREAIYACA